MVSEVKVFGNVVLNSHGGFYENKFTSSKTDGSYLFKGKDIKVLNKVAKYVECAICGDSELKSFMV